MRLILHSAVRAFVSAVLLSGMSALALPAMAADSDMPHLQKQGTATQLIVDGKPLLMRGGELNNSSGEPDYLKPFWPRLKALNLNTIVAPVYWDVIEPEEGHFDFSSVDGLIRDAHANGMHLVLLWFGTWKNSMSCYVPGWVKQDTQRFPRVLDPQGLPMEILSPYSAENLKTDARAFAGLMRHLRQSDTHHTVVLMQVENEIGMLEDARDHSAEADRLWALPVPPTLMRALQAHRDTLAPALRALWLQAGGKSGGSWAQVFGDSPDAEEVFMAWNFARYTDQVAAAGKAEYPLPMYVNAALIRPAYRPGQYPSAGPLPHLMDIWRAAAPSIDFLSPDIYFPNFAEWTGKFARDGNPLFIPESLRSNDAAVNGLYAYAEHDAMGFSPFGIETMEDPAAGYLAQSNDLVRQLQPLILAHQGRGDMAGLLQVSPESKKPEQIDLGGFRMLVTYEHNVPPPLADGVIVPSGAPTPANRPSGGLIIATGPGEYIVAGTGVILQFASRNTGEMAGLLSVESGHFENGQWQHERWLNGDQTHQGRHVRIPPGEFGIQRVKLYRYR